MKRHHRVYADMKYRNTNGLTLCVQHHV